MLKVDFVAWTVMAHIGGANPALSNSTLIIPSIGPNNGKTGRLKEFNYATWDTFSYLAIYAQVLVAQMMETSLVIDG